MKNILNIYYDGDCYFCTRYTKFLDLKKKFGTVNLISVRENIEVLNKFAKLNIKINNGMVVEYQGKILFGDEAFKFLNISTNNKNIFSHFLILIAKSKILNKIFYNTLVFLRYIFLIAQFKSIIFKDKKKFNTSFFIIFRFSIFLILLLNLYSINFIFSDKISKIFLIISSVIIGTFLIFNFLSVTVNNLVENLNGNLTKLNFIFLIIFTHIFTHFSYFGIGNYDYVYLRRIFFFIMWIPIFFGIYFFLKKKFNKYNKEILIFILIPFLSFAPGIYIVPFYNGIGGWLDKKNSKSNDVFFDYYLVNKNNKKIAYSLLFLQPNTMKFRFRKAFLKSMKEKNENYTNIYIEQEYMKFLYLNYLRIFKHLENGKMPNQQIFGKFSYPAHSLTKNNLSRI